NMRSFAQKKEDDEAEQHVAGHEQADGRHKRINRNSEVADVAERWLFEGAIDVEEVFDGYCGQVRVQIVEPVEHVESKHDGKSNPHRPTLPHPLRTASFGQVHGQLNQRKCQTFSLDPGTAHQLVDKEHRKTERDDAEAPPQE